jgi:hypothetical protein
LRREKVEWELPLRKQKEGRGNEYLLAPLFMSKRTRRE